MIYQQESDIPTPFYIVYESRIRHNLSLISHVAQESGAKIIMAFKANALWKTFPIVREYCRDFTASSLNELMLGCDELGGEAHSYCPAYTDETIGVYLEKSTHITFNSLHQFERFKSRVAESQASPGLRVNPQCSVIETDIYNPALPGSRFGVTADVLREAGGLPEEIEGLHFHALCEGSSHDLEKVLEAFERDFGDWIDCVKWVNMGGGHLMTRQGYDIEHLIDVIRRFRKRHPGIDVVLEPGSAFMWRTGDLITSVVDIVDNQGIKTAIIDASFACHMPDCLEMPYKPAITSSMPVDASLPTYRLGGNSCLSGDFMGDWSFARPLRVGDRLRLEDMNHYTTVKTNMFNGIQHPSMILCDADGRCHELRRFTYEDYRSRMD